MPGNLSSLTPIPVDPLHRQPAPATVRLGVDETVFLLVDYQERLCAAMPPEVAETNAANCEHLLVLASELGIPVVVTEQYPQGLGPTIPRLDSALADEVEPLAKTFFSALRDPAVAHVLRSTGRRTVVLMGMETHICVFQSARDLVADGFAVHVPADAVVSRTKRNWEQGLSLIERAGATVTTTETVLFDLLGEGRGDVFKLISRRLR